MGNLYEWMIPEIRDDFSKMEAEINYRKGIIMNYNVREACDTAQAELAKRL